MDRARLRRRPGGHRPADRGPAPTDGADDASDRVGARAPTPGADDAGYAAPTGPTPPPRLRAPTNLGAPLPGFGATAATASWQQPAAGSPARAPAPAGAAAGYGYDATAVLGRRYGAFLIDAAISLIVFGILFFATATTHTRFEMLQEPGCHLSANDSSQVECNNLAVVTVNDTVYET